MTSFNPIYPVPSSPTPASGGGGLVWSEHDSSNNNNNSIERSAALSAVEADAASIWPQLPEACKNDKEFILRALRSRSPLPSKDEFERQFPQALRFDRDVVMAFCARDDFADMYYERHLFVPDCLTGDKGVMLAYCRKIPRSLQECSEDLCDDQEVVEAAVSLDGLELQYASARLQEDVNVVWIACQKDGRALEFCPPGRVRSQLTVDRDFMLKVLSNNGGPMLKLMSGPLRKDRELLLAAFQNGLRFRYCPLELQTERSFLLELVAHNADIYLEFSQSIQRDREIARAAIISENSTDAVHNRVLDVLPRLVEDRAVMLALARRGHQSLVNRCLSSTMGAFFCGDFEVMLAAIERNPNLFQQASRDLQERPEIVLAAISEATAARVLEMIGLPLQTRRPEISLKAIRVTDRKLLGNLLGFIPEEAWMNRDVALAWLQQARFVLTIFVPLLQDDRELALAVAVHAVRDFMRIGPAFQNDFDFVMEAVTLNGRVWRYITAFSGNLAVAARAVASHPNALLWNHRRFRDDVKAYVTEKLKVHETFENTFSCGIAVARPRLPPHRRSGLTLLDQGTETSQALKKLIAEFVGVPMGIDLVYLRKALQHLSMPPGSLRDENALREEDIVNVVQQANQFRHMPFRFRNVDVMEWVGAENLDLLVEGARLNALRQNANQNEDMLDFIE
jgi:hypothetical protein